MRCGFFGPRPLKPRISRLLRDAEELGLFDDPAMLRWSFADLEQAVKILRSMIDDDPRSMNR